MPSASTSIGLAVSHDWIRTHCPWCALPAHAAALCCPTVAAAVLNWSHPVSVPLSSLTGGRQPLSVSVPGARCLPAPPPMAARPAARLSAAAARFSLQPPPSPLLLSALTSEGQNGDKSAFLGLYSKPGGFRPPRLLLLPRARAFGGALDLAPLRTAAIHPHGIHGLDPTASKSASMNEVKYGQSILPRGLAALEEHRDGRGRAGKSDGRRWSQQARFGARRSALPSCSFVLTGCRCHHG